MVFWILVALLAAAVTFAVTRPLLQPVSETSDASDADIAVYKDQLAEIDADTARGVLSDDEAVATRAEVARRLIRRAQRLEQPATRRAISVKPLYLAATAVLPLASLALYMAVGAPGLPGMPLSERLAAKPDRGSPAEDLIAKVEQRLREHPEDGKGWDVIAPVYLSRGQYDDAVQAYQNAMRLLGESVARLNGFAEARIRMNDGVIGNDAKKALEAVLKADPKRREPRIWLAIAKEQDGDMKGAAEDYRTLIAEGSEGAPWRQALQQRLAAIESGAAQPEKRSGGPSEADINAAAQMTAEERAAMINKMADGLAGKLKINGKDAAGWAKLIRAYVMLARKDDALKALSEARAQLSGDAGGLKAVNDMALNLGLNG